MYDQAFSKQALENVLQKRDFRGIKSASQKAFKDLQILAAVTSAASTFNKPSNPLAFFPLKKKLVFRLPKLSDELVERKLSQNLKIVGRRKNQGRSNIVGNLQLLLEEGVPYRIYRLDVKNFYESFHPTAVVERLDAISELSPHSKTLLKYLLDSHKAKGGLGIPRGLSLSALLSDLMMQDFDQSVFSVSNVYFYARYVDDIIIITSTEEKKLLFSQKIENFLPRGLKLNPAKKEIASLDNRVTPAKQSVAAPLLATFDYLGYKFSVHEPVKVDNKQDGSHYRDVTVDIASAKIKKIKIRIVRSFLEFSNGSSFSLLLDRIKFLSQNFSVYDGKVGSRKLAGIYHSYPQVSDKADGLIELDRFLRNSVLSKSGKLYSKTALLLSAKQKRKLMSQSFVRGHQSKNFVYFPAIKISEIQKCWIN